MRPNRYFPWLLLQERLSGKTPANSLLRCHAKKEISLLDQQFYSACASSHRALSQVSANRAVLQVDQAASAVKTQIWIAISVYVLVAIIKKQLKLKQSLHTILQVLSITPFEKMPLLQALTDVDVKQQYAGTDNQLNLFN